MSLPVVFVRGNTYEVDIPNAGRVPPPGDNSRQRNEKLLCLDGRSFQQVQDEAQRICLGATFSDFEEFDRCIDSWGVIHHRSVVRYKTGPDLCIRSCRFGTALRTYKCKSQLPKADTEEGSDFHPDDSEEDDAPDSFPSQEVTEMDSSAPHSTQGTESQADQENNHRVPSQEQVRISIEEQQFQNGIKALQKNAPPRRTLQPLQVNDPQGLAPHKAPRSFVKHTSVWLPGKQSLLPSEPGKKPLRRISRNGACGELERFKPLSEEDHDGFFSEQLCPWRVRAIKKARSGVILITRCDTKHNCPQHRHKWRGPTSKSKWLAETLAPRVTRNLKGTVKELQVGFQQDYKRTTNNHQMWRMKDLVRDVYLGGQRKSFHCIPALIDRIKSIDPGCKASWDTFDDPSKTFHRAFVCPSATRKALSYCQPVVSLDACHTKNRKYPTQLFLATALDGNMEIIPLAYALAPTENYDNWLWFLQWLDTSIYGIDEIIIPFMSDRCKGLIGAVKEVFPGKVHGMCANHLRANVTKAFGKTAESFFLATVYADTEKLFLEILHRLEHSPAKGAAAAEYIKKLDPSLYARHKFPLPRFGKVTSNPCEATNSGLLSIREYAPFKLIVEMWYYIQKHFNDSRKKANQSKETLTEPALIRHNENLKTFGQFQVFDDCGGTAKVQTTTGSEEYLVRMLPKPLCTCWELQEMGWPCEHVMAWDDITAKSFHRHFNKCWRVTSWQSLYQPIVPSFICNDLVVSSQCWPPEIAVKKGRHRMVRIPSGGSRSARLRGEDVEEDSLGNLFLMYPLDDHSDLIDAMPTPTTVAIRATEAKAKGRKRKPGPNAGKTCCRKCGKPGHNTRTCKAGVASTPNADEHQVLSETTDHEGAPAPDLQEEDGNHSNVADLHQGYSPIMERREVPERYMANSEVNLMPSDIVDVNTASEVPEYSQSEDDNFDDIRTMRFDTTQNPQPTPDYVPSNYSGNLAGIYDVQKFLDLYDDTYASKCNDR